MYGHALALLPKCSLHPDRVALLVDDHSDRLLCAECAQPLIDSTLHVDALTTIA